MSDSVDLSKVPSSALVQPRGSALEVLRCFAWLGVSCFGGPIAHLGYFRTEFVLRRAWLSERAYADLVALSQFLPGPASSKLGFSLGLLRAGYLGGLAAWLGFTLPSAALLVAFAYGAGTLAHTLTGQGVVEGLKLAAVAIVAQAVWGMARSLCPDRPRATIATVAAVIVLTAPTSIGQITAILIGGVLGLRWCREERDTVPEAIAVPVTHAVGVSALVVFFALLAASFFPFGDTPYGMFNAFYRSGALVFGGGHVVLPLLADAVVRPGWVDNSAFLSGYGAAQAVPGPLFTFAAFLGAAATRPVTGIAGAGLALVAIFLPGMLLQLAALPFWNTFHTWRTGQSIMRGVNAGVVGVLTAALYTPVWTSAVTSPIDFAIALCGFILLIIWKTRPLYVVVLMALAGAAVMLARHAS
jgi:chromate transporter